MNIDLETLIREHSTIMSQQMLEVAKWAKSEEDVRHECNKLIDDFIKKANLGIKGWHEYGLAGGRIDSKYGGVIIEYKDPKGSGKITEDPHAPGVKAVVKQIKKRFDDFQKEENIGKERIFAVGCDGDTFVFVRHRGKNFEVEDPQPVSPYTSQRLLRALVSLGARGYSFTPDNLCDHFGAEGNVARIGVRKIYEVISDTKNPKVQTFFKQWQILFGEVCGYDVSGETSKIKKLGEHYGIKKPTPAALLFSIHTYYAIFIKLLAAEIISSLSPLAISTLKKLIAAPTPAKLRSELEFLERGSIWTQLGIRNFLEGDIFSWYLDAWDMRLHEVVHTTVSMLDHYDPTTLSVEPSESRDLLKKLYQHLFPKSVRHDLGEYYTPDWLAELTIKELNYEGEPDKRILDPACGSGTFLVMTINRIKTWFDENRHECGFDEEELVNKILQNVIGFDLNPLAVMAARTNYLLAIRDLLRHTGDVEIPVYLCDSIMTPSEYGDLFIGRYGKALKLTTSAGEFLIPTEIAERRERVVKYTEILESCIQNRSKADDFISRCELEGIDLGEKLMHETLYNQLSKLQLNNRNGVWARIIKNAFAPLFCGKFDYVIGNPPWIAWLNLPSEYRKETAYIWSKYKIFPHKGLKARLGSAKDDISILFVYSCADNFLNSGGQLAFVITQTLFKSKGGGEGFRRFQLGDGEYLRVVRVHDMAALQPFEDANNRTSVFTIVKGQKTPELVPYIVWRKKPGSSIKSEPSLKEVNESTFKYSNVARNINPSDRCSPWISGPANIIEYINSIVGPSHYRARMGAYFGATGVYWLTVLQNFNNKELLIRSVGGGKNM